MYVLFCCYIQAPGLQADMELLIKISEYFIFNNMVSAPRFFICDGLVQIIYWT